VLLGAAIIGTRCYRRENAALQDALPAREWIGSVAHHESTGLWKGHGMDVKYTAHATSSGAGRDGAVHSDDGIIDLEVKMPPAMGGPGGGTNPEQLFAAGYAACFHGALRLVAGKEKVTVPDGATVEGAVGIGPDATSFAITVTLTATLPGMDQGKADELMAKAHQVCPYSKATRGNIDVQLVAKV
jgi:Ohr subfamily peroxiredoxin